MARIRLTPSRVSARGLGLGLLRHAAFRNAAALVWCAGLTLLASCNGAPASGASGEDPAATGDTNGHSGTAGHVHGQANGYMNNSGFDELVARFESPERQGWQMPQLVLDALGPLDGRTVMDLGAGTGYFSFRLAEAGATVIAADVDQRFLDYIRARRDSLGMPAERIALRKVPYDSPKLRPSEADVFLTVNTYHHIQDRERYFHKVRNGLDMAGRAVIVDFKARETPHGPPADMRVPAARIVEELTAAGFQEVRLDSVSLPEQVIVTAWPQPGH